MFATKNVEDPVKYLEQEVVRLTKENLALKAEVEKLRRQLEDTIREW